MKTNIFNMGCPSKIPATGSQVEEVSVVPIPTSKGKQAVTDGAKTSQKGFRF